MTRRIENRIEVPGTPEQVWEAIATGPGIEAWFVPARVEDGRVALDMGPGLEDAGAITEFSPPHRFVYEEEWAAVEGEPAGRLASEFIVEARSGGTCVVRLVSTLHADGEGWDEVLESMEAGWNVYLLNLRAHLTHFARQRCATVMASGEGKWDAFLAALGLADAAVGAQVTAAGTPPLAGTVEYRGERELMLKLTAPAPGIALIYAYAWKDVMRTNIHLYLFEDSAAIAAREAPAWRDWMAVPSTR
jgi:uncharacterized protein YndB with AHSA1/START domain